MNKGNGRENKGCKLCDGLINLEIMCKILEEIKVRSFTNNIQNS